MAGEKGKIEKEAAKRRAVLKRFVSAPVLAPLFELPKEEAIEILVYWMALFNKRHPKQQYDIEIISSNPQHFWYSA